MRRFPLGSLAALAMASVAAFTHADAQGIVLKPADRATNDAARRALARIFVEGSIDDADVADAVTVDPILAALLGKSLPSAEDDSIIILVDPSSPLDSWGVPTLGPEDLAEENAVVAETARRMNRRIAHGRMLKGANRRAFLEALRGILGPVTSDRIRPAVVDDLAYYWSLIPWDLEEPVMVVQGTERSVVVDFVEGRIFFVTMLPPRPAAAQVEAAWRLPPPGDSGSARVPQKPAEGSCPAGLSIGRIVFVVDIQQSTPEKLTIRSVVETEVQGWRRGPEASPPSLVVAEAEGEIRLSGGSAVVASRTADSILVEYDGVEVKHPRFWTSVHLRCGD